MPNLIVLMDNGTTKSIYIRCTIYDQAIKLKKLKEKSTT